MGILQELRTIPVDKRRSRILAHVREEVAQVLGHKSAAVSQSQGLFEMGMDSLTSVELRNRLQNSLECSLPSTFAFDYPTVETLVDYLVELLPLEFSGESDIDSQEMMDEEVDLLDELSEDELVDLLAQELEIS